MGVGEGGLMTLLFSTDTGGKCKENDEGTGLQELEFPFHVNYFNRLKNMFIGGQKYFDTLSC